MFFGLCYLLPLFIYLMVTITWILPSLIVASCIQKFISPSQHKASQQPITNAEKCLNKYADLYKGFGSYFMFVLEVSQLLSILTLSSCILQVIGSLINNEGLKFMYAAGLFCISSGLILNITGLTFILDSAYISMKGITTNLEDQLLHKKTLLKYRK
jgi:hypothetical protein